MIIKHNAPLAALTSLRCGGVAETLLTALNTDELLEALRSTQGEEVTILGYGTNSLISDRGLAGTTIITRGGSISLENGLLIADAGAWWDDLVQLSIEENLWGIELMSGIPSSVGGAIVGNIAAYGQQACSRLAWVEVFDRSSNKVKRLVPDELSFAYRSSSLQNQSHIVVLRAALQLSEQPTTELRYESAQSVGKQLGLAPNTLKNRRAIILATRRRAGSLWEPDDPHAQHTAGSFFKNPLVSRSQAEELAKFDETGKSLERLLIQNKTHGGDRQRASAAHVLLAAGFTRGQSWGDVRLHPDHILKIENTGTATAQEVYTAAQHIMQRVKDVLDITLEPEVKFVGHFDSVK